MTIDKESFCYVPFYELYVEEGVYGNTGTQRIRNCCIQTESYETDDVFVQDPLSISSISTLQNTRTEFLQGKKPKSCERCWIYEQKGFESYRQIFNKQYSEKDLPTQDIFDIRTIDVRLSNKCNLACKMCNTHDSNQIAKNQWNAHKSIGWTPADISIDEFKKRCDPSIHADRKNHVRPSNNKILDNIINFVKNHITSKCNIKLAGGEPFIMPEVEEFLQKCIDNKLQDKIFFLIITNATSAKQSFIQKLQQFDHMVNLSIDGVGDWLEYQRTGAKWSAIDQNVTELSQQLNTNLIPCWSHLNLFALPDFFKWVETKTNITDVYCNEVTWPTYLNWEVIPMQYRQQLIDQLEGLSLPDKMSQSQKQNYLTLFDNIKKEYRDLTQQEKQQLNNDVKLWDFKNPIAYIDRYIWGKELLN